MTTSTKKKSLPEQPVTVPWVGILQDAEDGLLALSVRVGLQVLQQMMAGLSRPEYNLKYINKLLHKYALWISIYTI